MQVILKALLSGLGLQGEQEQLKYLPHSVKLEEAVNPHIIRLTMIIISVAIFIFVLWSAFTPIKEVTRASGEVVPRGHTQVVQHLDGGIVTEILVGEGDLVESGQVLIKIDDGQARQELIEARSRQQSLLMQKERLEAYVDGREASFSAITTRDQSYYDLQHRIFDSFLKAQSQERVVLEKQIQQKESDLTRFTSKVENLTKSHMLSSEALALQQSMHVKGFASKLTIIQYQKEAHEIQGAIYETKEELRKSKSLLSEYRERLTSLSAKQKDDAYEKLESVKVTLGQVNKSVDKLFSRVERLNIRAPVYGLVKGLKINTIGGIIGKGKTLMEVVPLDSKLVVDAKISTHDIGHIRVGQRIRVKVSSYDFSRYGTIEGTLDFLSATTFLGDDNQPYYQARIGLSKNYVGDDPEKNIIVPGMTVISDIITGEKTLLEYLLKPIHLSMKSAFSER